MKGKANRTGRNDRGEQFTLLIRNVIECPAWAALSTTAQAIYPFIRMEWHGPRSNNNGRIQFSYRQAAKSVGVSLNTAMRGFHDLQAKGFIVVTELGALGVEGVAKGPTYEITEIEMPNSNRHGGRRLFRDWKKGRDFDVAHHCKNNPKGINGRKIPSLNFRRSHHQNSDVEHVPVAKMTTPCLQKADVGDVSKVLSIIEFKTSLITTPCAHTSVPDLSLVAGLHLCPLLKNSFG